MSLRVCTNLWASVSHALFNDFKRSEGVKVLTYVNLSIGSPVSWCNLIGHPLGNHLSWSSADGANGLYDRGETVHYSSCCIMGTLKYSATLECGKRKRIQSKSYQAEAIQKTNQVPNTKNPWNNMKMMDNNTCRGVTSVPSWSCPLWQIAKIHRAGIQKKLRFLCQPYLPLAKHV